MWADSHCHIPYEKVEESVIEDASAAGVARLISVGTDAEQSAACIAVASAHPEVWATVGLHPHDAKNGLEEIERLLDGRPEIVGIGECGLDYFYDHSPRDVQREVFAAQIALARQHDLALVIHTRDAWDDTFDILRSEGVPERTIFHCFTGGPDQARPALELGAWLSFSGIVTFPKAPEVREAAALCPLDRLLVETDAPFLAPVPYRGKSNTPMWVPVVGAAVAACKGIDVSEVEASTWAATAEVFSLPLEPVEKKATDTNDGVK